MTLFGSDLDSVHATTEAVEAVEEHAAPEWLDIAYRAVKIVAGRHETFTTDDVWAILGGTAGTHEARAMGAVMNRIRREKIATPTSSIEISNRPECHRRPVRVWRSARD